MEFVKKKKFACGAAERLEFQKLSLLSFGQHAVKLMLLMNRLSTSSILQASAIVGGATPRHYDAAAAALQHPT